MVHAEEKLKRSVGNIVDTDPEYFTSTIGAYDLQHAVAQRLLPGRLAAYKQVLGKPVRKVLEIGPGSGAYAKAFVKNGAHYIGIEVEERIAEQTRKRTGLDVRCADFIEQTALERDFDLVFASQVFEHIQFPASFLRRVKQVAPGGLLHIDVPNHGSLVSHVRKLTSSTEYGFIHPPYHMLAYSVHSLESLLQREGFRDILVKPYSNNHLIWGQLVCKPSPIMRLVYWLGKATGSGSLLTALARVPPSSSTL